MAWETAKRYHNNDANDDALQQVMAISKYPNIWSSLQIHDIWKRFKPAFHISLRFSGVDEGGGQQSSNSVHIPCKKILKWKYYRGINYHGLNCDKTNVWINHRRPIWNKCKFSGHPFSLVLWIANMSQ